MSKLNPCRPDCPDRTVGCQARCEKMLAAKELQAKAAEAKARDNMFRSYFKDSVLRKKRRKR